MSQLVNRTVKNKVDVVVVGAGPIGIELAVALGQRDITVEVLEAGNVGHTMEWWAPGTRWFSSNDRISIAGVPLLTPDQSKATREQYLTYLRAVVSQFDLPILTRHRVTDVQGQADNWVVTSNAAGGTRQTECGAVVLAVGGTDFPRTLGVEGEDLPHVDGYLREPHRYFGRKVLIVGGRNSAIEAALRLHHVGAKVSLSYRGDSLPEESIKYWLLPEWKGMVKSGKIQAYFDTTVHSIRGDTVQLADSSGNSMLVEAQDVLTLIGYEQDKTLFHTVGIELAGPNQAPIYDEETMETNLPGIYIAGTAVAGTQSSKYRTFLENCHEHVDKIVRHLTGSVTLSTSRDASFQEEISVQPES